MLDGEEVGIGFNPLSSDADGARLNDSEELTVGISPFLDNSNFDLIRDSLIKHVVADGFSVSYPEQLKGHHVIASFAAPLMVLKQTVVLIHSLSSVV